MAATNSAVDPAGQRALHAAFAVCCGAIALLVTAVALLEASAVRDLDLARVIGAGLLGVGAIVAAKLYAPDECFPARAGLRVVAASIVAFGAVETPAWVSIETFGISAAGPWLALCALLLFYLLEHGRCGALAGALALLIFSAFGGPLFIRDGDDFHGLHALLAICALCAAPPVPRGADRSFRFLVWTLIALAACAIVGAVDRDRHLEGFVRLLAALAPLPLASALVGSSDSDKRRLALAILGMTAIGVLAAFCAVLEGGLRFELVQAARVRLPLFGEHPNIIAPFFAVMAPWVISFAVPRMRNALPSALCVLALVTACMLALGLTRSRAAAGGVTIALLGFCGIQIARRFRDHFATRGRSLAILGALVVVIGAVGFFGRHAVAAKLTDSSMQFRTYMWQTALSAIEDRPLLGYGLLAAEPLMNHAEEGDLDARSKDTHPHMLPLAIALGIGIPAALVYLLLVLALVLRATTRAIHDIDATRSAIAAGIAASATALFASNLLDQGLALHTSFPLHLGLLLAAYRILYDVAPIGTSIWATTSTADSIAVPTAPSKPPRPSIATQLALGLGLCVVSADLIAARLVGCARNATRNRQYEEAETFTRIATYIDPLGKDVRLAHADALDHVGKRLEAQEELARLTEILPFSPYPWERLANLEYDRRNLTAALMALERAKRLDPTGPSAAQWSLRMGNIYANLGMREDAMNAFALAMRFDFAAAQRAGWLQDGQKEYYIPVLGSDTPIYLTGILKRNRELLPELVKTDPIKARRLATTLAKIELSFRRYRAAKEVIALYGTLTPVPWLPLEHLASEIARHESTDSKPDATPPSALDEVGGEVGDEVGAGTGEDPEIVVAPTLEPDDATTAEQQQRFAAVAGQSILFVDRAQENLRNGNVAAARRDLAEGLSNVYDMVAERETIARLLDAEVECAKFEKDLAAADRATRRSLYFRSRPSDRLEITVGLGMFRLDQGDARGALDAMRESIAYTALLPPDRSAKDLENAATLARRLLADKTVGDDARDFFEDLEDEGHGLALACLAYSTQQDVNSRYQRLKREFPEWLPSVRVR